MPLTFEEQAEIRDGCRVMREGTQALKEYEAAIMEATRALRDAAQIASDLRRDRDTLAKMVTDFDKANERLLLERDEALAEAARLQGMIEDLQEDGERVVRICQREAELRVEARQVACRLLKVLARLAPAQQLAKMRLERYPWLSGNQPD